MRWIARGVLLLFAASLVGLPLATIFATAFSGGFEILGKLASTLLPHYAYTTWWLLVGAGSASIVLGTLSAGLVTCYRFPGVGLFRWALALPLAMPAYVTGFVYTELADSPSLPLFGGIQTRTLWGLIAVFTIALYPYVFLLVRAALLRQSTRLLEAGRVIGLSPLKALGRIAVPLARPSILVGGVLVMLEVLNDFATVRLFALQTISTAIYEVWWLYGSAATACQIALLALLFVAALLSLDRYARRAKGFAQVSYPQSATEGAPSTRIEAPRLRGAWGRAAALFCFAPIFFGFLLPCLWLIEKSLSFQGGLGVFLALYARAGGNTLWLATATASATTALGFALVLLYHHRRRGVSGRVLLGFAASGYALPGTMLAMGGLIMAVGFQTELDRVMREWFGISSGLFLVESAALLVLVYMARFLTIALGGAENGFRRVTRSVSDAARLLGLRPWAAVRKIYFPLLRADILAVFLIVFIDTLKELSATFLLLPFDFQTLATRAYEFIREEQQTLAAPGALVITLLGAIATMALARLAASPSRS